VTLADLLAQTTMLSAPLDATDLGRLRALLFQRLRASGWTPAGDERGEGGGRVKSDEALLTAFARGDGSAFDALFDRHAARLNGHARRWLQAADAADAVQEAFVALFAKGIAVLDREDASVGGFLFVVLRNRMRDVLAARETPVAEPDPSLPAPFDDALTATLRREDTERLARLLDRACGPLEQDVVLRTLEDHEGPAIAAALDISEGHVRVLRHRAYAKLRRALEEEAP
jgi:RNA polymerase sigma-70 factor (ECF subfamily)